ncbi:MAG: PAS domain S-box protein [Bacteroidales bacterium]|nr:PAS domain S-box protein [Bacteroidales bacterium]
MKHLPNILIVDDSEVNLLLLEIVLKNTKANLIQARSGSEALKKTRGIELALAIIDVRMPKMNGYELALKMNEERSGDKVPIIFLTASHFNKMEVFNGYGSGAVDYLFKPVDNRILLCKVNVFLDLFNQKQTIIREAELLKESADELTRVNAALKKSEEKYRNYIDNAPDGVFVADETGRYIEVNEAASRITGYSRNELLKMSNSDILPKESLEDGLAQFRKAVQPGASNSDLLFRHKNGTTRWCTLNAVKLSETRFLGFIKDITERKITEQSLKVSEEKYKTMLNASPDGILLTDMKGTITEVSEIGLELFGTDTRDDLVGKKISRFVPSEEKKTIKEIIKKTMDEGLVQNVGVKIRKKNKSLFAAEISATLIQGPDGAPVSFMIIVRDISQRKKMEAKQMHADRMANLGEMASGIAHEINQPLNIISLIMDKILFESAKTETINVEFLKNKSNKIFENITRIRNIIDHIRTFSRSNDDYVLTAFDINSSIKNAASMIAEQFKHLGINLNLQLKKQIPQILGNTYKFEQVIINLLANAKDAVIEMKSKQKEYFEMIVGIRSYQENQFIIVEVTDNGIGISNNDINNIILPFYTTKDEGKGTGLGLSICYQIIKEMDGTIDITSKRYHGTKIKIVLDIQKKK